MARARTEGSAPLGPLTLEILDRHATAVGEWYLEENRVLGARPCARNLSLLDLTVEGPSSEDTPGDHPQCPPLSPGLPDPVRIGRAVRNLLGPGPHTTGITPATPTTTRRHAGPRAALDAGERPPGGAKLLRVDTSGPPGAAGGRRTAAVLDTVGARPRRVDLTLAPWSERPPLAAEQVWRLWSEGRPPEPGSWARCDTAGREFWPRTALDNHPHGRRDSPADTTYHLNGRHITAHPGFFCALGEAVNGPGLHPRLAPGRRRPELSTARLSTFSGLSTGLPDCQCRTAP
ncbi:hypothetical protein ACFRI7_04060 [Streptomyces sp. NPDC056716]|uniref:hypothetical protein n=1 Tax=unclassified Streptomyces TaxID=2593676 RepID=UPI00368C3B20